MRSTAPLLLLAALVAPAPPSRAAPGTGAPTADAGNWKRLRDHVLPDRSERAWRRIPWRATLWDAVVDAHREKKPVLLWAMNGHPLACT